MANWRSMNRIADQFNDKYVSRDEISARGGLWNKAYKRFIFPDRSAGMFERGGHDEGLSTTARYFVKL
jgi:hypothetical protein